eukprot:TRINITY_DN2465_c0_g2_i2.p1 TRINITY_DN2465_c0_g2~~TRINITY_DN2465_c0_g2_i2.p1  ORF type:complete len:475 (-),score=79.24 TRINITY_DN2465_c0_g2_i2:359-1783(-)
MELNTEAESGNGISSSGGGSSTADVPVVVKSLEVMKFLPVDQHVDTQRFFDPALRSVITIHKAEVLTSTASGASSSFLLKPEELGPFQTARLSPKRQIIALVHASRPYEIVFYHIDSRYKWKHIVRSRIILDIFWTFSENLLIISQSSLEIVHFPFENQNINWNDLVSNQFLNNSGSFFKKLTTSGNNITSPNLNLKVIKEQKIQIHWFLYSNVMRMIFVSTGNYKLKNQIQGFYFKIDNINKLPRTTIETSLELLPQHLDLHQLYGRLYLIFNNPLLPDLDLYQITRETIIKKFSIPFPLSLSPLILPSSKKSNSNSNSNFNFSALNLTTEVSDSNLSRTKSTEPILTRSIFVVDNLLFLNVKDTILLYDIKDREHTSPIIAPFPSILHPYSSLIEAEFEQNAIEVYNPNFKVNWIKGTVEELDLDYEHIMDWMRYFNIGVTDSVKTIEFLLRRSKAKFLVLNTIKILIVVVP